MHAPIHVLKKLGVVVKWMHYVEEVYSECYYSEGVLWGGGCATIVRVCYGGEGVRVCYGGGGRAMGGRVCYM